MKLNVRIFAAMLVAGVSFGLGKAQERKITRAQLPPAVETIVARESEGATIKGFATEIEHGKKYYEASLVVDGHTKHILIDADGKRPVSLAEEQETVGKDGPHEHKRCISRAVDCFRHAARRHGLQSRNALSGARQRRL